MEISEIKNLAQYTLSCLKKYGADDAQCKLTFGSVDEINVDAGEFSLMRSTFDSSVTMKVIKDGKKGVIGINKTDKQSIDKAAKECVENAEVSAVDDCLSISDNQENEDFVYGVDTPDRDKLFDRINEYIKDIEADYPKVFIEQLIADFSEAQSVFANTNGVEFSYKCGYYSMGSMYSAHDGEKTTSFNSLGIDFSDLDKKIIDQGIGRMMYALCEKELDAVPYEGKFTGTAVIAPSCLGDIIGTAVSNFTGDDMIIDSTSPWRDKLGEKVASDKLTVKLIPIDDRVIGGERYTGEGYKTKNCTVINKGVLESFTLSEYAARKSGEKRCSTLSGCMEVEAGDTPYEDLIKNIDQGILVCRFSGGVPAGNGDFSGVAKNSFLIENGKITKPILETMISGNLRDMMQNVTAVSKETAQDGSCVFPWVAFDGVTVSGK
ncbi:MAG: TldD/PmbA family protein [Clostridiales bacterium]|nr:TldD/PmbA family protein [Clostridiales bacterium]